jgi:hypothetical protein
MKINKIESLKYSAKSGDFAQQGLCAAGKEEAFQKQKDLIYN